MAQCIEKHLYGLESFKFGLNSCEIYPQYIQRELSRQVRLYDLKDRIWPSLTSYLQKAAKCREAKKVCEPNLVKAVLKVIPAVARSYQL